MAGPNVIGRHHETGLIEGENTVVFNFAVDEDTIVDWKKADYNPVVKVEMKLRGNRQVSNFGLTQIGTPAKFEMSMGEQSYLELPISPSSFLGSINYSPDINDVRCTVSNPTQYIEKVIISTSTNYPVSLLSTQEVYVGPNSEEEFSIFVSIDENFLENYSLAEEYWFYTNASVAEISGVPPANPATDSNIVTQVQSENQVTCSDCFILHHILAGSRIGMKAPTYSGDLYNGETWRSFNSDDVFETSLNTPFSTAWTALQFIDLNCQYCRMAASEEMVDWVDRFDPSNSSQGSPNVDIVTVISELIPSFSMYGFTVSDAAGSPTNAGGEDLVYVAMDAGDDLSWVMSSYRCPMVDLTQSAPLLDKRQILVVQFLITETASGPLERKSQSVKDLMTYVPVHVPFKSGYCIVKPMKSSLNRLHTVSPLRALTSQITNLAFLSSGHCTATITIILMTWIMII